MIHHEGYMPDGLGAEATDQTTYIHNEFAKRFPARTISVTFATDEERIDVRAGNDTYSMVIGSDDSEYYFTCGTEVVQFPIEEC